MKKRQRAKRSFWRFTILMFLALFLLFFLSGTFLSKISLGEHGIESGRDAGAVGKISRVFFIKDAVDERLEGVPYVTVDEISPYMLKSIVAVEDSRFYAHPGFDIEGIMRATLVNLQAGEVEEGASTITQQLVKNLFLTQDQTFFRKGEELVLALSMEHSFTKEKILELYLNTIYFGSNFYGIQEASYGYFGKAPADLTLAESAMLAGLPNAPSLYSPFVDFVLAKKRQIIVLDAMEKHAIISSREAADAKIAPLELVAK